MNDLKKLLIRRGMQAFLWCTASWARREKLGRYLPQFMKFIAARKSQQLGVGAVSPQSVAFKWQRSFPAVKHVPIVKTEGEIVHAQILTPCPLRGSHDMRACARMMSYDREIVLRANGYFAVTRSQAQGGVTICEVAISTHPISHLDVTIHQLDA
jgi:hypothetical protein